MLCLQPPFVMSYIILVEGRVIMPLTEVSLVCEGGQLELNCTITGSLLQWRIIPDQNQSQLSPMAHTPLRNQSFEYGGSTVMFVILSQSMEMTTYRTLFSPVSSSLNGTVVECTDLEDRESSSTFISVVNAQGISYLYRYKSSYS